MTWRFVGSGRHRILIAEHEDSAFIASYVDGTSLGGFYSAEECYRIAEELVTIGRAIRKRKKAAASGDQSAKTATETR